MAAPRDLRGMTMAETDKFPVGKLNGEVERALSDALRSIRFGTVTLVVQDGRIIQIEKNEKFRLNKGHQMDGSGI
jgi:hypothetical protein